ncbi:MAG TPA: YcjX family protein [Paracoccaceae bacterium]|nr:YcjX family protein [Paracoccaceae bacterium]
MRPEFARPEFAPPRWSAAGGNGPPHIRLDRAIEFLIGDRLE